MNLINCIDFPQLGDDRGELVVLEQCNNIPFDIKRVYYIFNTKIGVSRGFHAHKKLRQVAVCVAGKCRMIMDNGESREEVWLSSPIKGLVIEKMMWHEMHDFSKDCVLLVLANNHYDEGDYIRKYKEFKKLCKHE